MSRYVHIGLLCEGHTDSAALPALADSAIVALTHSDVLTVPFAWNIVPAGRPDGATVRAARESGLYDIVLVHRDGGTKPQAIWNGISTPVRVVPVREMESWLVVDPEAFARAGGVSSDVLPLGLPTPGECEALADPKALFDDLMAACFGVNAFVRDPGGLGAAIELIASQVSIDRLLQLTWFSRFSRDLREALVALGWPFRHGARRSGTWPKRKR